MPAREQRFICLFKCQKIIMFKVFPQSLIFIFAKMDGILEWILSSDKGSMFSPAFFLAEEELDITIEMLHICGVMPETNRSLTCIWNKAAQSNLTALYASLYGFWILSE